jgi:tetratricopeptide (TPR) repeat protein
MTKRFAGILLGLVFMAMPVFASSWDDAWAQKREAVDIVRQTIGRPFKADVFAAAIKKLELAEQTLKTTPSDEPDSDENMLDDLAVLQAWAKIYAAQPHPDDKKAPAAAAAAASDSTLGDVAGQLVQADAVRSEARQLKRAGRFDEAAAKNKEFVAIMDKLAVASNPDAVLALDRLAHYFMDESSYKLAELYMKRVLDETEKRLPPTDLFVLRDVEDFAWIQNSLGNSKAAEPLYKRVIAGRERVSGRDDKSLLYPNQNLANIYKSQAKWDAAEANLKIMASIRTKVYPKDDPRLILTLIDTADLNMSQGKLLKAEELYKQALEQREKAYGPDDERLFGNLRMLGVCYVTEAKNFGEAEQLYNRALALAEKRGPNTPNVALILFNLAHLYNKQNRLDDAERSIRRSLEIREKCFGSFGAEVAWSCNVLGNILRAQGHKDLAEAQYKRSIEILEKQFGPDHQNVASPLLNLGNVYLDLEDFAKAEQNYMRALNLLEKVYGDGKDDVARLCNNLSLTYGKLKKWPQAVAMHKRAVQIAEKVCGPDSLDLAQYLSNYAQTLKKMNNFPEADKLNERAKAIRAANGKKD